MIKKLKDICQIEKGQQIDTDLLDGSKPYKYINGGIRESGFYDEYNTKGTTITVSEGGASCGYVNIIHEPFWCGCHCYKLTQIKVQPKYLYFNLKANQEKIMSLRTGSAMPNIRKSSFMEMQINVTNSNDEQRKIVTNLEKIEEVITKSEKELLLLDEMIKSRFNEMFGEVGSFTCSNLKELTTKITDGSHNPPKGVAKSDYLMASSQNIYDVLDLSNVRYLTKEQFERENRRTDVQDGDVLFTIVGTIGRTHIIKNERLVFQRSVAVIKPNRNLINSTYLKHYLSSDYCLKQIDKAAHGVAQIGIYLSDLKELSVPVPKMEDQLAFESFITQIDKLKFN